MRAFESGEPGKQPPLPGIENELTSLLAGGDALPELAKSDTVPPGVERILDAERWLTSQAWGGNCPDPELIFDCHGGPGSQDLDIDLRERVERHVQSCTDCSALIATLTPPPLDLLSPGDSPSGPQALPPLTLGLSEPEESAPTLAPRPATRWWAAAAAAGLLALAGLQQLRQNTNSYDWPPSAPTLVRGERSQALLFPRGVSLEGFGFSQAPVFEIEPRPGAETYRVIVRRTDGGAFDQGHILQEVASADPILQLGQELSAGFYTWEAWVTVDGLDRPLGELEFRIEERPEAKRHAERLQGEALVSWLHRQGLRNDARQAARDFPGEATLLEYLERPPDR